MANFLFLWRTVRQTPAVPVLAVLTLALGIGANTAIFSVVKAVLLNPLPYAHPDRLVTLAVTAPDMRGNGGLDPLTVEEWRGRTHSLESLSMYRDVSGVLMENGRGEIVRGLRVYANFFDVLGVKMQLGRGFLPEEDTPDRRFTVIILSDGFWKRRFGGDPHILGRVLDLSGFHYRVVGVLPADFAPLLHGTSELLPEMYMPAGGSGAYTIARLEPGVGLKKARAELDTLLRATVSAHPEEYRRDARISMSPMQDFLFGRMDTALLAVLGAAGFVLLIACANVTNLLLGRAAARSKEIALRAALGASRWDLIRHLLTESFAVAVAGGSSGLLLAWGGTGALAAALPPQLPRTGDIHMDAGVFAFTLTATVVTGLLCSLAPCWHAMRLDLNSILKGSGKESGSRHGIQRVLVIGEVALAFVLVSGALLMAKTFARLLDVNPGYDPYHVLTLSTNVWGPRYQNQSAMLQYYQQTLARIQATPGVDGAAWTSMLPLDAADRRRLYIEGRPVSDSEAPIVEMYSVSNDYFRVMKIPLKRGRSFADQDSFETPKVALISESCARRLFPHEDPIGKHIRLGPLDSNHPWATIVGIVGDIRQYGLDRTPNMEAYMAQSQDVIIEYYRLVARTSGPPMALEGAVRAACASVDGAQPVYHIKPLEEYLEVTLAPRTLALAMLGLFAVLAMVLAAAGIYGVTSYLVALRTREVGIRMALGARRRDVVALVLRQTLWTTATGLGVGVIGSLFLKSLIANLLFRVRPSDWQTSAVAVTALIAVALAGSYRPAYRAASVDPTLPLREE